MRGVRREHQGQRAGLAALYERKLARSSVQARRVDLPHGGRVHVIEVGDGPPVVMVHGTGSPSLFFWPLLERLRGVRAVLPDRPGRGLSDPVDIPRTTFRAAAIEWVAELLDTLELDRPALLGHSMGGLWALWFALAHPDRVARLLLLGPPKLPGTSAPLPYRVMATPGLGALVQRLAPPTPKSMVRFAGFMGEAETLVEYPDLIDVLVATGRSPVAARADRDEVRAILSPIALLSRSGFRQRLGVQPAELRRLAVPTMLVWGDREPLGDTAVAQSVVDLIPDAQLDVVPGGHAPWLGRPEEVADLVSAFAVPGTQ